MDLLARPDPHSDVERPIFRVLEDGLPPQAGGREQGGARLSIRFFDEEDAPRHLDPPPYLPIRFAFLTRGGAVW